MQTNGNTLNQIYERLVAFTRRRQWNSQSTIRRPMDRLSLVDIGRLGRLAPVKSSSSGNPTAAWRCSFSSRRESSTSCVSCVPCLGVRGCILMVSMEEVLPRVSFEESAPATPCREVACFWGLVAVMTLPLRCLELINFKSFHEADRQLSDDEHVARVSETADNPDRDRKAEAQCSTGPVTAWPWSRSSRSCRTARRKESEVISSLS